MSRAARSVQANERRAARCKLHCILGPVPKRGHFWVIVTTGPAYFYSQFIRPRKSKRGDVATCIKIIISQYLSRHPWPPRRYHYRPRPRAKALSKQSRAVLSVPSPPPPLPLRPHPSRKRKYKLLAKGMTSSQPANCFQTKSCSHQASPLQVRSNCPTVLNNSISYCIIIPTRTLFSPCNLHTENV